MEAVKDRFNRSISIGDKVRWYDPQIEYRDLKRIYEVTDIQSDEMIWISDDYSDVEVNACELEIIYEII